MPRHCSSTKRLPAGLEYCDADRQGNDFAAYIVARSAELALEELPDARVARILEVGPGVATPLRFWHSSSASCHVDACARCMRSARNLRSLRLSNVRLILGDGALGVSAAAPSPPIVAAAAGDEIPPA